MQIISERGEFELPENFSISVTLYNTLLNEQGDKSYPLTMPATRHNLRILQNPERVDGYYRPLKEISVDVVDGIFQKEANLVVHSANERDGITCTLYFNDGYFYTKIADRNIREIALETYELVGASHAERVGYLVALLKSEYANQTSTKFSVVPLQTDEEISRRLIVPEGSEESDTETFKLVLNGFETDAQYLYVVDRGQPEPGTTFMNELMGERTQTHVSGGIDVSVGKGYGMTAFVNLKYFMETMFAYFGYDFDSGTLTPRIIGANERVFILNNVADAIYDGKLVLSDLLPDMSVKEFLKSLGTQIAGVVEIDEAQKQARIRYYEDMTSEAAQASVIGSYLSSGLYITGQEQRYVSLRDENDVNFVSAENRSYIDIRIPPLKEYEFGQCRVSRQTIERATLYLRFLKIEGGVIHLNSSVVSSTSDKEATKEVGKALLLGALNVGSRTHYERNDREGNKEVDVEYINGKDYLSRSHVRPFTNLAGMYEGYLSWMRDSNISVECEVHLPLTSIYGIDLTHKIEVNGTLYYVDRIEFDLPYKATQRVYLKTARAYAGR